MPVESGIHREGRVVVLGRLVSLKVDSVANTSGSRREVHRAKWTKCTGAVRTCLPDTAMLSRSGNAVLGGSQLNRRVGRDTVATPLARLTSFCRSGTPQVGNARRAGYAAASHPLDKPSSSDRDRRVQCRSFWQHAVESLRA